MNETFISNKVIFIVGREEDSDPCPLSQRPKSARELREVKAMVKLTAKNPFGADVNVLSWRAWLGLVTFAGVAGVLIVMTKWFAGKAEALKSPADKLYDMIGV